jgi:hypothetical protein
MWDAFACILSDKYVFPAFEISLGLLFLYAHQKDLRVFRRVSRAVRTRVRRRSGPRGSDSAELSVQRGPESREQFYLAYGFVSVIVLQVVNAAQTLQDHKTILSILDIAILVYLAYFSGWMRNKIINGVVAWRARPET